MFAKHQKKFKKIKEKKNEDSKFNMIIIKLQVEN